MRDLRINTIFKEVKRKIFHSPITPRDLKKLYIVNYVILLLAVLVAFVNPPLNGYDFSIYDAYPGYFWVLIILVISLGQFNAILSVLGNATKRYWVLGFLAILIADSVLLFLPLIRGYFIYGSGDILTHIGYMRDIQNSGSIGSNLYPILHMLGCSISYITGFPLDSITMAIPAIFSIFSVLCWYILGREIFNDKLGIIFLVVIAALPMYGITNTLFSPNHEAYLILPLILYTLIKFQKNVNRREIILILILLSVLIVFFHPLVAIMIMVIYALFIVSDYLLRSPRSSKSASSRILITVMIMAIVFSIWSTYLYLLKSVLDPFISSLTGTGIVESEGMTRLGLVSGASIDILNFIKTVLLIYGIHVILGFLSILCISYLLVHYLKKQNMINNSLFFSIMCFLFFFIIAITIFFTINEFGYGRIYNIALPFSIVIISSTITAMYRKLSDIDNFRKNVFSVFVCILIVILTILSIFSLHLSPLVKMTNQQVPMENYFGMVTFFETRDDSIGILELGVSQLRYFDAIYGESYPETNIKYSGRIGEIHPIDHLGYTTSLNFGSHYDGRQYFLLTEDGRKFYENMYPKSPDKWIFTDQDFERLESDVSTIRIYSNGNLDTYMLN